MKTFAKIVTFAVGILQFPLIFAAWYQCWYTADPIIGRLATPMDGVLGASAVVAFIVLFLSAFGAWAP